MIQFSEIKILDINLNKTLFKCGVEVHEKACKKQFNLSMAEIERMTINVL